MTQDPAAPLDDRFVPLGDFPSVADDEMIRRAQEFRVEVAGRRTVREFSADPVPRAVIEEAIRAAGWAPSGANRQPWHFTVIEQAETKRRIRLAAEEEERAFYAGRASPEWLAALAPFGTDADKPFLEIAPVLIVVFSRRWEEDGQGGREKTYYPIESTGIATGLLIAALHHAGLATLTHTPSPMGFLTDICGRPAGDKPFLLLVVGRPAAGCMVPRAGMVRKPLAEVADWR